MTTDQSWKIIEAWMDSYGDKILRMVYLIVSDYQVAEEITQEVFVRAYSSLDSFRGEASPYTWLYRIALNLSRNHLKRRSRFQFLPFSSIEQEDRVTESLEEVVVLANLSEKIRKCLGKLSFAYREIIVLYYLEDMKVSEIAHILGQPEGTVKSKLSRGRKTLEKIFREEGLTYEGEGAF